MIGEGVGIAPSMALIRWSFQAASRRSARSPIDARTRPRVHAVGRFARVSFAADGADACRIRRVADGIALAQAVIPIVSNVTGELADAGFGSPAYWTRTSVRPVRFADSARMPGVSGGHAFRARVGPDCGLTRRSSSRCRRLTARWRRVLCEGPRRGLSTVHRVGGSCSLPVWGGLGAVLGGCWGGWVVLPSYAFSGGGFGCLGWGLGRCWWVRGWLGVGMRCWVR